MTGNPPTTRRGAVHRLALNATSPDPAQRLACIPPGRAALRTTAHTWGITSPTLDDLLTIATELITNAIQHAPPATIHATLRLAPAGDRARIEVTDTGSRLPRPGARPGDQDAERGRGLLMIAALADRWGVSPAAAGKTVWAELALSEAPDVPAITRQARRAAAIADVVAACRQRATAALT